MPAHGPAATGHISLSWRARRRLFLFQGGGVGHVGAGRPRAVALRGRTYRRVRRVRWRRILCRHDRRVPLPMSAPDSVLFIDYAITVKLLPVLDAMAVCEDVFRMHARNSVKWSVPPSQRLDVGAPFHNHWPVKTVILEDEPIAGVRLYSYYDDGLRNTVGRLDCARYIVLADPRTGHPVAILDEHWTYAIRSAAAAMVALKWLGPKEPKTLGLVGIGTMGENCLRCLRHLYNFREIVCTSRRKETREAFAAKWSQKLGVPVHTVDSVEEVVRG